MAGVDLGRALEQAKAGLADVCSSCATVDTVVDGGPRQLPTTRNNVFIQGTQNISPRRSRGGLTFYTFELRLLIESQVPAERRGDDPDAAAQIARSVRADRWQVSQEIGDALDAAPRGLRTVSAELVISGEDSGYTDNVYLARAWGHVLCLAGPIR